MNSVVLDASAILAVLHREPGHEQVRPHLKGGLLSAVNLAEVLKKTIEKGGDVRVAQCWVQNVHLLVVPFDEQQAVESAKLWPLVQGQGISAADRACLTLGLLRSATVLTSDERMSRTSVPVQVTLIRGAH